MKSLYGLAPILLAVITAPACTPPMPATDVQPTHHGAQAAAKTMVTASADSTAAEPTANQLNQTLREPASTEDGSSPEALAKVAKKITRPMKHAKWIQNSEKDDSTDDPAMESAMDSKAKEETDVAFVAPPSPAVCTSVEYAGNGLDAVASDHTLAARAQTAFHDAKENLLGWLSQNRHRFPSATFAFLESRIRSAQLTTDAPEADLQWRGVGVWTRDNTTDDPTIKLGSGFYTLMKKQPARARFEMTRLLAQSWSPCELDRKKLEQPWGTYLRCMGFPGPGPEQAAALGCGPGGYSEAGWAVSSAVATTLANPGCEVPAFNDPSHAECPKNFLLPLMMGAQAVDRHLASESQEARK